MEDERVCEAGATYLGDLPLVALVCAGAVVGEGLGTGELMVGGWGGDYVALACYLAGEAGDGTGDWGCERC